MDGNVNDSYEGVVEKPSGRRVATRTLLIAVLSLWAGTLLWSTFLSSPQSPTRSLDGGQVFACQGEGAFAFIDVGGVGKDGTEILLPLRGDSVLLPVVDDAVQVLVGDVVRHQQFIPVNGRLAVIYPMADPAGDSVVADVGGQRLTLPVQRCGSDAEMSMG